MLDYATLTWVFSGVAATLAILVGVIWKILREESKLQAEKIEMKASTERIHEIEQRWKEDLENVRTSNEKLINKLEIRHDREIEQLASRLSMQIQTSEQNILRQMQLMHNSPRVPT